MQPRKPKLGQNFLVDDGARHRIVDALGDISTRTVFEIGPGHGAITAILAERARRLVCIELDRALAAELRFRFRNHPNVEIMESDVLKTDFSALLPEGEKADVIGNLPYYITSDILLHLFAHVQLLDVAVLMMQREVAERVAADPGTRDYGLLSCTAQMYGSIANLFTLPPEAFSPPPEVYSTVLRIAFAPQFDELCIPDPTAFDRFLKMSFQQKRKTLGNNLRAGGYSGELVIQACNAAEINPGMRAEALALGQLAQVFNTLSSQ